MPLQQVRAKVISLKTEFEYTNRAGESGPAPGIVPGAPMKQFDLVFGG